MPNFGNVPNLRFPGFEGEWERYKISDVLDFFPTNSLSWEQLEYTNEDNLFNLHYGLIHKGLPIQIDSKICNLPHIKKGSTPKNYTICEDGDIAFADASEDTNDVGKVVEFLNCAGKKIVCGLHTIHGRDKKKITVPGFKGYAFSSMAFRDQIKKLAQGTKIYSLSTKNFSESYISIPSKAEQVKIADLLYLIDQRIETQNQIIKELETLMKGLSSRLFSQELRFKNGDGNSFPDWEYANLKSFGTFMRGLTYGSGNVSNEGLLVLRSSNIQNNTLILDKDIVFVDKDCSDDLLLQKGDIVICMSNGSKSLVGKNAEYIGGYSKPITIGAFCSLLRTKNKFAKFILQTEMYEKFVTLSIGGGNINNLKNSDLENYTSLIPTDKKEQQKIMNILGSLSGKIKTEQNILSAYQKQKKYFLRHMFI